MAGIANQNRGRTFDVQLELSPGQTSAGAGPSSSTFIVDLGDGAPHPAPGAEVPGSPQGEIGPAGVGDGMFPRVRGDLVINVSSATEGAGQHYLFRLIGSQAPNIVGSTQFTLATYEAGDAAQIGGTASRYNGVHVLPFENVSVMLGAAAALGRRSGEQTWLRYVRIEVVSLGAGPSVTWSAHISNLSR